MNLSFIKKAAPWIGAVVSATVPGAAPFVGIAAKLLSDGFGTKVPSTSEGISEAITTAMANPEQLAKLKEIDNEFALHMRQLDIQSVEDFEKLAADDRDSARKREIAVRDWVPAALAVGITVGFFTLLFVLLRYQVPEGSKPVMDIMLGALATAWISVVSYYFGSSAGSARKTELLEAKGRQ